MTLRPGWVRAARVAAWVVGVLAVVVVLAVFVFPTRTYLDQRRQINATATELHVLDQQNSQLAAEATKLQTNAEIERIARQEYHLVRPGEQAFGILPAPTPPTTAPPPAHKAHDGGVWHALTSWL